MVQVPNPLEPIVKPDIIHQEPAIEADDLAFLNEFANADLTSNLGDDVIMGGSVSAAEGENDN